jgi:hypothetical protein
VFPLSVSEYNANRANIAPSYNWWTRSPGMVDNGRYYGTFVQQAGYYAGQVSGNNPTQCTVTRGHGMRPALWIDPALWSNP